MTAGKVGCIASEVVLQLVNKKCMPSLLQLPACLLFNRGLRRCFGAVESSLVVCRGLTDHSYHELVVLSADGTSRLAHTGPGRVHGHIMDSRGCLLLMDKNWTLHVVNVDQWSKQLEACPLVKSELASLDLIVNRFL